MVTEVEVSMEKITGCTNRHYGGEGDIRILAEDMKLNGLINAITLKRNGESQLYEIVAGRRRVLAAKVLGWQNIRSNILELEEEKLSEAITGSENINRLAMHPLDEAAFFKKLLENGETLENMAKRYDRTKAAIWQRIQLLDLNDGIKEMFREGKISLHSAAMLKSLDEGQQVNFIQEYKDEDEAEDWDVQSYISNVHHDKLYKCVAGKKCSTCKTRTYFSDKELFPELHGENDVCLAHECYMERWKELLQARIKKIKEEHPEHKEANILLIDNNSIRKIFGKSVSLQDGVEYAVKQFQYGCTVSADKNDKDFLPCFELILEPGERLDVTARYWKEAEEEKKEKDTYFGPMVKLLDLPKEEAEQTVAALKVKCDKSWEISQKAGDICSKIREKVFNRMLEERAKQPDKDKDIDLFLTEWLNDEKRWNKKIIELFAGSCDVKSLRKLSWPKLFALLHACQIRKGQLPYVWVIAKEKKNDIAEWAGVSMDELKEMYKEELRPLLPKPEAVKKQKKEKPVKGKEAKPLAKEKAAADKPVRAKVVKAKKAKNVAAADPSVKV